MKVTKLENIFKMLKGIYWRLYIIKLSLRWIRGLNLGKNVWWKNEKWMLVQGVCAPCWDLVRGEDRCDFIHESEFKAVQNPKEWWLSFKRGYDFYMKCWFDIWVNNGIEPWVRKCNIWMEKT